MEPYQGPSQHLSRRNPTQLTLFKLLGRSRHIRPFVVAIFLLVVVLSAIPLFDVPIMGTR